MSNYKYAIKKLPIKSWIKYWLWRNRTGGTKYKFALSDIQEGSNFYLENTIKRKFNIFEVYGKTTQNGTPTPENPIPIINLTGNINEKVQNKNIASLETSKEMIIGGVPFTIINGIINLNGTLNQNQNFYFDSFQANSNNSVFSVEVTGYTDRESQNASIILQESTDNETFTTLAEITLKSTTTKTRSIVLDSSKYYRVRMYAYNGNTFTDATIKVQLEYGTSKTVFIPHAEQNISFPLSEGQIFAQGDYLADDGIHHAKIQKPVNISSIVTLNNGNVGGVFNTPDKINDKTSLCICERAIFSTTNEEGTFYANNRNLVFVGSSSDTLETIKEKYDGGIVEYPLAEEVVEPYTSEQQTAYNQIKELYTYNEITNIDGDANLKIKYWERVER